MIWSIIIIATFVLTLYIHVTRNFQYWKNRNIPYVKPLAFFGNLFTVCVQKQSIGEFLKEIYNSTKTPYLGFFLFDKPFILIRDPDIIKKILIKDFQHFSNHTIADSKHDELVPNMLFFMKNSKWRLLRKHHTSAFSSFRLKRMFCTLDESSEDVVAHLNEVDKNNIDCRDLGIRYGIEAVTTCGFSIKPRALEKSSTFCEMSKRLSSVGFVRGTSMSAYFVAPTLVKVFRLKFFECKATIFLKNIFISNFEKRRNFKQQRDDLIDILLQLEKENGKDLDDLLVVGTSLQFLFAGYETTGSTIAFALYELSMNQSVQDRLRNEMQSVLDDNGQISYDTLQHMEYLDMVFKETLRKYPIVPFLDRRCENSYKVPGSDLVIEKGVGVYISLMGLHYDEKFFPNPDTFEPKRFADNQMPSCIYMPFGDGLRKCLGSRFAVLSIKLVLMKLLLNFRIEPSPDTPSRLLYDKSTLLVTPKGGTIYLKFQPLHSKEG